MVPDTNVLLNVCSCRIGVTSGKIIFKQIRNIHLKEQRSLTVELESLVLHLMVQATSINSGY